MKGVSTLDFLLLFLGGGTGTLFRFIISQLTMKFFPSFFPLGTLIVNLTGSFIIGFLGALFLNNHLSLTAKLFLMTGFLGGFTTFSSFSMEVLQLIQMQKFGSALLYVLVSNLLGFGLCFVGFSLAQK